MKRVVIKLGSASSPTPSGELREDVLARMCDSVAGAQGEAMRR